MVLRLSHSTFKTTALCATRGLVFLNPGGSENMRALQEETSEEFNWLNPESARSITHSRINESSSTSVELTSPKCVSSAIPDSFLEGSWWVSTHTVSSNMNHEGGWGPGLPDWWCPSSRGRPGVHRTSRRARKATCRIRWVRRHLSPTWCSPEAILMDQHRQRYKRQDDQHRN